MQKLTIEQLNGIVALMNMEEIKKSLEQFGFRHASKNGVWEFDLRAIANAKQVDGTEWHEDTFDDRKYHGEIYTNVKEYPNTTFINIAVIHIHRQIDVEVYEQLVCFTNAPINEEYEKRQNEKKHCTNCKKEFAARELVDMEIGRKKHILCSSCFQEKLNEHIQKRKTQLRRK